MAVYEEVADGLAVLKLMSSGEMHLRWNKYT